MPPPEPVFFLAAEDPAPTARYKHTRHGWEPAGAFPPPEPVPLPAREHLLRLIQETINHGVTPRRAIKWWTYILSRHNKP